MASERPRPVRNRQEQCIAKASADKPKNGELEEGCGKQLDTPRSCSSARKISFPNSGKSEKAIVRPSPPFQMGNGAYIDPAGPYDKGMPSVYYISPPDPKWSKADQEAYIPGVKDLLFTSVHEVWPGTFSWVPALEPRAVETWPAVRWLRVRGRLGALHRADDVGRRTR